MAEPLSLVETLQRIDLLAGRDVSIRLGSNVAGNYPLLVINAKIQRSDDVGAPSFKVIIAGEDSSRLVLSEALFVSATWDDGDEALLIDTTAGLLLITTRQPVGISKRLV